MEWDESKHPRNEDGEFTDGNGGEGTEAERERLKELGIDVDGDAGLSEEEKRLRDRGVQVEESPYQPQVFVEAVQRRLQTENNSELRKRYQEYIDDVTNEPKISADMQEIARDVESQLLGFQYRLKNTTKERFYQKVAEEPTKRNKDNVRYTVALGDSVQEYQKTVSLLQKKGYKPVAIKNYWLTNGYYKGINTNWESPNGTLFEIQFHSEHNLAVKEELHPLYERERDPNASIEEKRAARKKQSEISAKFKKPNGIEEVR